MINTTKKLYLGDPHVLPSNLEESERLLYFVVQTADKHGVDEVVILGDLFHTFGVVRVEVINFWKTWLQNLSRKYKVVVLTGNHDYKNQSNDKDPESALDIFDLIKSPNLILVKNPTLDGPFAYLPYIHDNQTFIKCVNELAEQGAKVAIGHVEVDGAQFENGFYAPNGVNQNALEVDLLVSGHVHKRARFGKTIYPGTARWLSKLDANNEKGLWLVDHNSENGSIVKEEFVDVSSVCTPIYKITVKEGEEDPVVEKNSRTAIEFIGSSEWVSKQKAKFKGRVSISSKITDVTHKTKRSAGKSIGHFLNSVYEPSIGIDKNKFAIFMKEIGVL